MKRIQLEYNVPIFDRISFASSNFLNGLGKLIIFMSESLFVLNVSLSIIGSSRSSKSCFLQGKRRAKILDLCIV